MALPLAARRGPRATLLGELDAARRHEGRLLRGADRPGARRRAHLGADRRPRHRPLRRLRSGRARALPERRHRRAEPRRRRRRPRLRRQGARSPTRSRRSSPRARTTRSASTSRWRRPTSSWSASAAASPTATSARRTTRSRTSRSCASLPGMTVLAPGDPADVQRATRAAFATDGPVYLRLGKNGEPNLLPADASFVVGRATMLRDGADVTLASTGAILGEALVAADALAAAGVEATVLHYGTVKPFDAATLVRLPRDRRRRHARGAHDPRRPGQRRGRGAGRVGRRRAAAPAGAARRVRSRRRLARAPARALRPRRPQRGPRDARAAGGRPIQEESDMTVVRPTTAPGACSPPPCARSSPS